MATSDFLSQVPASLLSRILREGAPDETLLRQQLARGQELQRPARESYSSPWAAALGGLAGAVRTGRGAYEEQQAMRSLENARKQRGDAREALLGAYTGGMQRAQVTAPDVIAPGIGMPDATAGQLALADTLRGEQREKREDSVRKGAAYLGLLSGDEGLRAFSQSLLRPQTEELRAQALELSAQRLAQAGESADRRSRLFERSLATREAQFAARQTEQERKAAEKKVADQLKLEEGLRKEVFSSPVADDYLKAQVAFAKVERAAANPSAAGDLALIFGVMKTFDPGSTVREGEFASAQNAGGVDDRIRSTYNRILAGERLTPEQRADFVRTAGSQFGAQEAAFQRLVAAYRGLAQRTGANVENVIPLGAGGGATSAPRVPAVTTPTPAGGADVDLSAPAQPPPAVDSEEIRTAEAWLKGNPTHPDAPTVRERLQQLRATGGK